MNKIDSYLNVIYEIEQLSEETGLDLPKINKGIANKISKALDEKDPKGSIQKIKKLAPPGLKGNLIPKAEAQASKRFKEFAPFKATAVQIIKNSVPGVTPKMADAAGSYLAVSAMFTKKSEKNKQPKQILKANIKEFVTRVRKFGEDYDEGEDSKSKTRTSDVADMSVAWVIIVMASGAAVALAGGALVIANAVGLFITGTLPLLIGGYILLLFIFGVMGMRGG